ncbi:MAG: glycoside hydrolase family 95-like protein, partial [Isosphaeraceae bacterium]
GNVRDFTDRRQVMQHARYCLRAAIRASEVLNTDPELRAAWRDRLDHCAGDDGQPPARLSGIERLTTEANPPEFGVGRPYTPQPATYSGLPGSLNPTTWYFGQYPWSVLSNLRGGSFIAARDYPSFTACVRRWRHPNGLVWAMAIAGYGHAGAWAESLGVIAPLQEMMLQSWDGALRIFPAWPRDVAARFTTLRAEGAFLVSASWADGEVRELSIQSERGATCHIYSPWPGGIAVIDSSGASIATTKDEYGRSQFPTRVGVTYRIRPAGRQGAALDWQPKRGRSEFDTASNRTR